MHHSTRRWDYFLGFLESIPAFSELVRSHSCWWACWSLHSLCPPPHTTLPKWCRHAPWLFSIRSPWTTFLIVQWLNVVWEPQLREPGSMMMASWSPMVWKTPRNSFPRSEQIFSGTPKILTHWYHAFLAEKGVWSWRGMTSWKRVHQSIMFKAIFNLPLGSMPGR